MEPGAGAQVGSDAELITRVRAGDTAAFGELYRRHVAAATSLARQVARSQAEADDLVSESFARVLDGLKGGGGPDAAFRAYLFTTLRHTAYDRTRKDSRLTFTDDVAAHETPVDAPDPVIAMAENGMVGKAFASLPERWQAVLWHTQVEGLSPADTGVLLGMSANAVTSLAFRAREGLREAYLQAHLAETAQEQCRWTTDRLGAWARGGLSKREQTMVDAHLESCDRCAALAAELVEINSGLRGILAPLLLGGLAAGYLSTLGPVGTLTQAGALVGTGAVAGTSAAAGSGTSTGATAGATAGAAATGGQVASVGSWFTRSWGAVGVGAAAAAVAAVVAVIVATAGGSPSTTADQGAATATASAAATGLGTGGSGGSGGAGNGAGAGSGTAGPTGSGANSGNGGDSGNGGNSGNPGTGGAGPNETGPEANGTGTNGPDANGPDANGTGPVQPDAPDDGLPPSFTDPDDGGQPNGGPTAAPLPPLLPTTPTTAAPTTGGPATAAPTTAVPTTAVPTTAAPTTRPPSSTPRTPATPTSGVPTTRASSTAPRTTAPSTPRTTSRPTTTAPTSPTTPTNPTTTPPTTSTPKQATLTITASASILTGSAGGTAALAASITNSGDLASSGGSVLVAAPAGVSVSRFTPTGSGLRGAFGLAFVAAALPPGCTPDEAGTSCALPDVPGNQTVDIDLELTIASDAKPGDLTLRVGEAFTTVKISITQGITDVTVIDGPEGSIGVGSPTPITLGATLGPGVTDPGPITVPVKSGGIWVTEYPDTCTESAGVLSCQPVDVFPGEDGGTADYGTITITVMPDATTDDSLQVTVPHGGDGGITIVGGGGIPIQTWQPGSGPVDWTGPFGGRTVGTETMRCSIPFIERDLCRTLRHSLMVDIDPAKETGYQQHPAIPDGANLLVARLTWIGSAPEKQGSLDTAQLAVNRDGKISTVTLKGTPVACANDDPCPVIRSADVPVDLLKGSDAVWLQPLRAAKVTTGELTPMAAWSLSLVWMDAAGPATRVTLDDSIRSSVSGVGAPDLVPLVEQSSADLTGLSGAVWAADPWAEKEVLVSGSPVVSDNLQGRDSRYRTTGFDLIDLNAAELSGSSGGVSVSNQATKLTLYRPDRLWIGPLLAVRSIPGSQHPAG